MGPKGLAALALIAIVLMSTFVRAQSLRDLMRADHWIRAGTFSTPETSLAPDAPRISWA